MHLAADHLTSPPSHTHVAPGPHPATHYEPSRDNWTAFGARIAAFLTASLWNRGCLVILVARARDAAPNVLLHMTLGTSHD